MCHKRERKKTAPNRHENHQPDSNPTRNNAADTLGPGERVARRAEMDLGPARDPRRDCSGAHVPETATGDVEGRQRLFSGLGFGSQRPRGPACLFAAFGVGLALLSQGGRKAPTAGPSSVERPPTDFCTCDSAACLAGLSARGDRMECTELTRHGCEPSFDRARIETCDAPLVVAANRCPGTPLQSGPHADLPRTVERSVASASYAGVGRGATGPRFLGRILGRHRGHAQAFPRLLLFLFCFPASQSGCHHRFRRVGRVEPAHGCDSGRRRISELRYASSSDP